VTLQRGFLHALQQGTAYIEVAGKQMQGEELASIVGGIARSLAGARRVAIAAHPTLDTLLAVAGVLLAGAAAVPINPTAGDVERDHILNDSGADLILETVDHNCHAPLPNDVPADESPALVMYTSGSTGRPKGVLVPRRAIATNLDALQEAWQWTSEDVLAHSLPFFHLHGLVFGGLGPMRNGSRLVHTGIDFEPVARATLYFGVPSFWGSLTTGDIEALRGARLLVTGAAALPRRVFDRILAISRHRLLNRYAMTETLVITSPRLNGERSASSVGTALPGVEVRLTDLVDDRIGSIEVRGNGLFLGYLGQASPFTSDGWFPTGDLGVWNERGELELVGRSSVDLIKTAGYRVGAGEVEEALLEFPGIAEAAVIGVPDELLGQRVAAWVVAHRPIDQEELTTFLAARLASYKVPSDIRLRERLPRTALGKLNKRQILSEAG
jgi:acyl-CoA synthetase (AMP-forming)/AMP-acid ligase II